MAKDTDMTILQAWGLEYIKDGFYVDPRPLHPRLKNLGENWVFVIDGGEMYAQGTMVYNGLEHQHKIVLAYDRVMCDFGEDTEDDDTKLAGMSPDRAIRLYLRN